MTSNSQQSIKNWTYTLPKNCSPVEHFLLAMKTELGMLESTQSQIKYMLFWMHDRFLQFQLIIK